MKQVELYRHNKSTYDNLTRIFETDNRCAVIQPTGSGKSFLIYKMAQDNPDKKIIVFEPNRYIISRVSEQSKEYGITNIEFLTYQKLIRMTEDEISQISADYICLDELHRTGAKEWRRCVEILFEKFSDAKFLGLTATPQRSDGVNILDDSNGEIACNISLGDAIVRKILPVPTYISALYTFDEEITKVEQKINECTNSDEEKADMRKQLSVAKHNLEMSCGVSEILKKHIPSKIGKYIVFCQNITHLDNIRPIVLDWFKTAGYEVTDYVVHSKNTESDKQFKDFDNDGSETIRLLFCVAMLNEGVHLDNISGVIMLRPTMSNIVYFQQLGRAIDATSNKVPLIFDLVNNSDCVAGLSLKQEIENAVENAELNGIEINFDISDFHLYDYISNAIDIFSKIESRCINDFEFRLKQLEEYKAKWGHCCVMKKEAEQWDGLCKWAVNTRQNYRRGTLSNNVLNRLLGYGFIFDNDEYRRKILIEHLDCYHKKYNNYIVPKNYVCNDGYHLGRIISGIIRHHSQYAYDIILKYNIEQPYKEDRWDNMFNLLKQYIKQYNKLCGRYTVYKGQNLGIWCGHQIALYKQHKLSDERYIKLLEIGALDRCHDMVWNNFIQKIKKCIDNNIEINVNTVCDGEKIGRQLFVYKRKFKSGKMSNEHYQQLLDLGIDLSKKRECENDNKWHNNFLLLQEFLMSNENITHKTKYKGVNLGGWYGTQLTLYNQGKLRKDRVEKLMLLRDDLLQSKNEMRWNKFVNILTECLQNNIQISSKTLYKNVKVGEILSGYRERYKKETLPDAEERYQQLLELGIDLSKEGSLM